ncbi:tautomerase [Sulfitobacter alexandrii]|uniref:Tautomerase n=1 Tax=Sulfitobacter alexandrii TaxID=1917485 RepID=A0A1J0WJL9_9RHOB|nr:tautomerase family protein [Sulfitobacter alexandrii]APE44521.1 tautomerase [Sulfitobacter alexandrii]
MPVVEIHLIEGYPAEVKSRLATALTQAVRVVVPAPPEAVTVLMHDLPASDYYRGGSPRKPADALPDPAELVRAYLAAMEARDLDKARAMQGDGFVMVFPGTPPMTRLEELLDWAAPRYRFVTKRYAGFDTAPGPEAAVVYARGTLEGEWPDGTAFAGIRFIDRFEVTQGRITRQDVWNDIAETRASERTPDGRD